MLQFLSFVFSLIGLLFHLLWNIAWMGVGVAFISLIFGKWLEGIVFSVIVITWLMVGAFYVFRSASEEYKNISSANNFLGRWSVMDIFFIFSIVIGFVGFNYWNATWIFWILGGLFFLFGLVIMMDTRQVDKRFKTGYRDNEGNNSDVVEGLKLWGGGFAVLFFAYYVREISIWVSENVVLIIMISMLLLGVIGFLAMRMRRMVEKSRKELEKKKALDILETEEKMQKQREVQLLQRQQYLEQQLQARVQRQQELLNKYQDTSMVDKIIEGEIWLGQTGEQLLDAIGSPEVVDRKLSQKKSVEIWKYHPASRSGVFKLKITLTDEVVTAINDKT